MKPTPVKELAQSDPKEIEAIQAAIRAGRPLFFIQAGGSTLEVTPDEAAVPKLWASIADRSGLGYRGVQMFKRTGSMMQPIIPPQ